VNRAIDAVLFDLDDTLLDDSAAYKAAARRVAAEVAAERGIAASACYRVRGRSERVLEEASQEHLAQPIHDARVQLWSDALIASGVRSTSHWPKRAASTTRAIGPRAWSCSGALDSDAALRARGCKLAIVTNGFAATHDEKIDRVGLREHVDAIFLADTMGMVKPDPEISGWPAAAGQRTGRTAMVGDRYDRDIIGAAQVGCSPADRRHAIPLPDGRGRPTWS